MDYAIEIPGFEGQDIKVDRVGFFKAAKIYVDGQEAPKGSRWLTKGLTNNSGETVDVRMVNNFVDPIPTVMVGNDKYHPTTPLSWGQYIWAGWPIFLIFAGGLIGAVFGVIAGMVNGRILRNDDMTDMVKYGVTGAISVAAVVLYLIIAVAINL